MATFEMPVTLDYTVFNCKKTLFLFYLNFFGGKTKELFKEFKCFSLEGFGFKRL
jgi:hypothetical protein